ncbi:MAG: DUF2905 domain-containing protein [Chloroflexi bacterium]|nr:DUF2905 domain-containing protein [Chloroflexota bacterium]
MPDLSNPGRWLMLLGLALTFIGSLVWFAERSGMNIGRLPGDFQFSVGSITCIFPLATSILLSLLLTLIINVAVRWLGK